MIARFSLVPLAELTSALLLDSQHQRVLAVSLAVLLLDRRHRQRLCTVFSVILLICRDM